MTRDFQNVFNLSSFTKTPFSMFDIILELVWIFFHEYNVSHENERKLSRTTYSSE